MIQELFGRSNVGIIGGERSKLSSPPCGGGTTDQASPSPSPSPSSSSAPAAAATLENNLRCPRCDSSNTKFCYYNNYNLTQPRHFCKTCRRYWTKGGALRNVPIGGGCRKNKTATIPAKIKTVSSEMGQTGLFETLPSNPIIWASSQNSHFLSLIRGSKTPNPNHITNSLSMKEEGLMSHLSIDSAIGNGSRAFGLDYLGPAHFPSMGISNLYRNQTLASQGILQSEVQDQGLQEVCHRLRTTTSNCYPEHAPVILGNVSSATSSAATAILESAPVTAGELGFWNSNISWPTTNGAYPI